MLRESHRPGIEPATCKSQVQRPTTEPPRNTFESNISDFFILTSTYVDAAKLSIDEMSALALIF